MMIDDTVTFVAIATAGGLRAAEAATGLPRSALSRRLQRLETRLGVQLAKRTPHSFALTPAGERLFHEAKSALDRVAVAEAEIAGSQERAQGWVRITAPMPIAHGFLPEALADFLPAHPDILVTVDAEGRKADLAAEPYDLALRVGEVDGGQRARRLFEECEAVYVAAGSALALDPPESPTDLERRPCILCRRSADVTAPVIWRMTDGHTERGIQIAVRLAVSDPVAAREYCAAGLGFASLPIFIGDDAVRSGRLVRVLPGWTSPRTTIRAVLPHRPTAAARAVLDHLVLKAKRRWPTHAV